VIRANGDPGGYRWGLERKKRLLEKERVSARPERASGAVAGRDR
jgi:hypothetical protein